MKKLLIILLFVISLQGRAQTTVTIVQDAKLATMSDNYNNTPPTANLIISVQGTQYNGSVVGATYEYAALQSNYHRLSILAGYTFWLPKLAIAPNINYGWIYHNNQWYHSSIGANVSVTYYPLKKVGITILSQNIFRSDIKKIRNSIFAGITLKLK